ncbi:hypothetical protein EI74_0821 [Mycoplasma testudineum]|uniref:Uncharacterized protein n=1 Tax=Mycoplasma testudineum TaxID=244584 RepID=A0A4R6IAS8_9MOLU|nr:hypothetical protein [Mycoplasma testudineum]OYD26515.1 hypothetical protein CG473_03680 [Mycoplasma testudineum]TDO19002.1 hypothetical protein EI74_0821 [Mycoplasma testudineum]
MNNRYTLQIIGNSQKIEIESEASIKYYSAEEEKFVNVTENAVFDFNNKLLQISTKSKTKYIYVNSGIGISSQNSFQIITSEKFINLKEDKVAFGNNEFVKKLVHEIDLLKLKIIESKDNSYLSEKEIRSQLLLKQLQLKYRLI